MPIIISGSNGISGVDGTTAAPAVQGTDGNTGVFFPAADQVAIATGGVQRLLVDASGNVTTSVGSLYPLVLGTAVASTSGTAIDFTGIPSWVRRVTVMLIGVSTTGSSALLFQIGAGSIVTSGYASVGSSVGVSTAGSVASTAGFVLNISGASFLSSGQVVFTNPTGNRWVGSGFFTMEGGTQTNFTTGSSPALAGALDRVRITTVNGTDVFDAGSVNIQYD